MTKKRLLWLDDIRNPFIDEELRVPRNVDYDIEWVLNHEQFVRYLERNGVPDAISFDHDLAPEHYTPEYFWKNFEESKKFQDWKSKTYKEKTGLDCVKWLADYVIRNNIEKEIKLMVHSANPVGAMYIRDFIKKNF